MESLGGTTFSIIVIPMLDDNNCYYIYMDNNIQNGAFVDVAEYDKMEQFRKDFNITTPATISLTTHHHYDHSGGNKKMKAKYPGVAIIGGADDNKPNAGYNTIVKHGDSYDLFDGKVKLTCLHTPCHTKGHICYYLESVGAADGVQHVTSMKGKYMKMDNMNRCVFTGDTLFIGGCGGFMEGNAAQMVKSMDILQGLPDDTKVMPGHEYTTKNF